MCSADKVILNSWKCKLSLNGFSEFDMRYSCKWEHSIVRECKTPSQRSMQRSGEKCRKKSQMFTHLHRNKMNLRLPSCLHLIFFYLLSFKFVSFHSLFSLGITSSYSIERMENSDKMEFQLKYSLFLSREIRNNFLLYFFFNGWNEYWWMCHIDDWVCDIFQVKNGFVDWLTLNCMKWFTFLTFDLSLLF